MITARKPELREVAVSEISLLKRSLMISTRKWWVLKTMAGSTVGVDHPLGKVLYGCGNSFDAGWEGFYDGKVLGTYLHGPLLPKNPKIADFVITKALQKKDPGFQMSDLQPLDDTLENSAREALFKRFEIEGDK